MTVLCFHLFLASTHHQSRSVPHHLQFSPTTPHNPKKKKLQTHVGPPMLGSIYSHKILICTKNSHTWQIPSRSSMSFTWPCPFVHQLKHLWWIFQCRPGGALFMIRWNQDKGKIAGPHQIKVPTPGQTFSSITKLLLIVVDQYELWLDDTNKPPLLIRTVHHRHDGRNLSRWCSAGCWRCLAWRARIAHYQWKEVLGPKGGEAMACLLPPSQRCQLPPLPETYQKIGRYMKNTGI